MKQATLTVRNIRVVPTKLGAYTTQIISVGNKNVAQSVRDNWTPGRVFTSRDSNGTKYRIGGDGSLRKM